MPTLEIPTFSQGITDNTVNGSPFAAKRLNNVYINELGKTVQRDGIKIYSTLAPQITPGNQKVDGLYYFDATLFVKSGTKLYYLEDGAAAWVTLSGPTGHDAFADSELGAKVSWSEWRGHLIMTPGPSTNYYSGCRTVKTYRTAAGTWYLVQAGMPDMKKVYGPLIVPTVTIADTDISVAYIFANHLVREYVAKVNGVNTVFKDYGAPSIIQFRLPSTFEDSDFIDWHTPTVLDTTYENYDIAGMRVEYYRTVGDQTELRYTGGALLCTYGNSTLSSTLNTLVAINATADGSRAAGILRVDTLNLYPFYVNQQVVIDDLDTTGQLTAFIIKINRLTGDITFSLTRGGAAADLTVYTVAQSAKIYYEAYRDDTNEGDLGIEPKVVIITASGSGASGIFGFSAVDIAALYPGLKVSFLDNNTTSQEAWCTAVSYTGLTATFSASRGGAAMVLSAFTTAQNATITFDYFSKMPAGQEEANYNDPCPPCYFSAVTDSYGWYAAPVEHATNSHRATRVMQSKPLDVDAVPGGNYVEVSGDALTALGMAGQHPIAFTHNETYRIENRLDAFGNGSLRAIRISESEGSLCQEVLKTTRGCYFTSENGFCYTDGFAVINLTETNLKQTYAALSNKQNMTGCYDIKNRRIHWGVESSELVPTVTGKNNSSFILDLLRTTPQNSVFTTASAGENLQPTSMHYDSANSRVLIGDNRGYIFMYNDDCLTDPVVNTAAAYSTWNKTGIVWDIITCSLGFGSSRISKRMISIFMTIRNLFTKLSMDIFVYKDDRSTGVRGKAVRDRSIPASTSGIHKVERFFPKGVLNCIYSMIQFKKGYVVIARSDDYVSATVDGVGNTALLSAGTWPEDGTENLVGHYIYFGPLYATGWEISIDSGNTLTVLDPGNTLPTGTLEWIVKGYPKDEGLELHDIHIDHDLVGEGYPERSGQGGNT